MQHETTVRFLSDVDKRTRAEKHYSGFTALTVRYSHGDTLTRTPQWFERSPSRAASVAL